MTTYSLFEGFTDCFTTWHITSNEQNSSIYIHVHTLNATGYAMQHCRNMPTSMVHDIQAYMMPVCTTLHITYKMHVCTTLHITYTHNIHYNVLVVQECGSL